MKININKDFEQEFQATLFKGMSGREVITGGLALAAAAGVVVPIWYFTDIPINVAVYMGIPVMAVIGFIGIYKYQGSFVREMLKEFKYFIKTEELPFETEERQENDRIFTMNRYGKGRR